jgi:putative inorganic carbon (HCO3(-)) transporter
MIDWAGVGAGALWITGLALLLAALSHARWLAGLRGVYFIAVLRAPGVQSVCDCGLALFCAGLSLSTRTPWQRIAWGVLALLYAGLALRELRRGIVAATAATCVAAPPAATGAGNRRRALVALSAVLHHIELWYALAAVPFLVFTTPYSDWAAAAVLVVWALRLALNGRLCLRTPVDWPLWCLLAMLPVTRWVTADSALTQAALYRLLAGIAVFLAVVNWALSPQRLSLVAALFLLAGIGLVVIAPLANTAWSETKLFNAVPLLSKLPKVGRPLIGEDINSNVLGAGLMLVCPVVFGMLLWWPAGGGLRAAVQRLALAACLLWMGAVLALTQSRAALLGLGVGLAAMGVLRWRRARYWAVLALLALAAWLWQGGGARLQMLADAFSSTGTISSLAGRQEVWSRAIYIIQDFPFTGIGFGMFDRVQPLLYPFFLSAGLAHHAHNLFLQAAVDLGLPGLIGYLALVLGALYATWQAYRACVRHQGSSGNNAAAPPTAQRELAGLALGLLGSQIAWLAHGLLDDGIWSSKIAFLPWFILGASMALVRVVSDQPAVVGSQSAVVSGQSAVSGAQTCSSVPRDGVPS